MCIFIIYMYALVHLHMVSLWVHVSFKIHFWTFLLKYLQFYWIFIDLSFVGNIEQTMRMFFIALGSYFLTETYHIGDTILCAFEKESIISLSKLFYFIIQEVVIKFLEKIPEIFFLLRIYVLLLHKIFSSNINTLLHSNKPIFETFMTLWKWYCIKDGMSKFQRLLQMF